MEAAAYVFGILSVIATILAGLFGSLGSRDLAIWASCAAICLAVVAGACWLQNYYWNKDTKTTDQRAWVAPIEVGGEPKANEPFRAVVRYKNTGKTIAKHVRIAFCAYSIPKGAKPDFNIVEKEPLSNEGADFPMMPDSAQNTYHTHNNGTPLTQHDVEQVESGEIVIFAFGKISYHDASDCPHWTKFCVFYDPAVKMYSIYPEYNETDQNICR